jgi:hypothetical protein
MDKVRNPSNSDFLLLFDHGGELNLYRGINCVPTSEAIQSQGFSTEKIFLMSTEMLNVNNRPVFNFSYT